GSAAAAGGCGDHEQDTTGAASTSAAGAGGGAGGESCTATAPGPTRGSAIAISPDDSTLVAVNRDAGAVTVLPAAYSGATPTLTKRAEVAVGGEPWQVAIDGCGDRAYVAVRNDKKVVEIVGLKSAPAKGAEYDVGSEPTGVALAPNNGKLYVANWI